ncbi:MAG: LON peptidase substrate-binding domain-containing protein, partial [bacterium]
MAEEIITQQEDDLEEQKGLEIPTELPLLPIRDLVIFPYMIIPLLVGREKSISALDEALKKDRLIFLAAQLSGDAEDPSADDINKLGTVSVIVRMLKTPDGKAKILVQGLQRGRISEFLQEEPFFSIKADLIDEQLMDSVPLRLEALVRTVRERLIQIVQLGRSIAPDALAVAENIIDPGRLADLVASNMGLDLAEAQTILEIEDPGDRLVAVHEILDRELKIMDMQQRIQDRTKEEMTKTQREYFLRQQL